MLKKIFEGFINVVMYIGMQTLVFIVGYLTSLHIYYAVDDWMYDDDAWALGALFVALNMAMGLKKMLKKRIEKKV